MPDTDNNPEWWIDGVSVGSSPEAAPETGSEPAPGSATQEVEPRPTPPRGVPAVGGAAPPPAGGGGTPPGPETYGATMAAGAATSVPASATGTLAPGTVPPPEPAAEQKRRRWPIVVLALLAIVGIAIVVDFVFLTSGPAYTATHGTGTIPVSASAVEVAVVVKNTGTKTGTPTCTVHVASPNGQGSGQGTFKEKPIDAGKSALFLNTVNVTKTTAHLMNKTSRIEVTCT